MYIYIWIHIRKAARDMEGNFPGHPIVFLISPIQDRISIDYQRLSIECPLIIYRVSIDYP